MKFEQIIDRDSLDKAINLAQDFFTKEQKKRKKGNVFDRIFFTVLILMAIYSGVTGKITFAVCYVALCVIFLITGRMINKDNSKKLLSKYVCTENLITAPETNYQLVADDNSLSISGTEILFKNIISAFLYNDFIIVVDKNNVSAVIKCNYAERKKIADTLYKNKSAVYSIDSNPENLTLTLKQNCKILLKTSVIMCIYTCLLCIAFEARLYKVSDLVNQKYAYDAYYPTENFAYQMSDAITDSHNIGLRLNIYCEYVATEYNTRINVCYDKKNGTKNTEIYFFDEDNLLYMVSAGYPGEKDKKMVAYTYNNAIMHSYENGSSFRIKQEESRPIKWSDEFMSMVKYRYSLRRYSVVTPGLKIKNNYTFKLKGSNVLFPDIIYRFKKDTIKITENSNNNNRYNTVFFVNTEQYIIDEIKQSFDKFETDINNYGTVKNIDFTELYSIVDNFR